MKKLILIISALALALLVTVPTLSRANDQQATTPTSSATTASTSEAKLETNLWLAKEGKHTNLVFRTKDAQPFLPLREAQVEQGPLVMLSWGDSAFYQAPDKSIAMALKALFTPTAAAINAKTLQTLGDAPQDHNQVKVYAMSIPKHRLQRILVRIRSGLGQISNTAAGEMLTPVNQVADARIGGYFYPATDRAYSLLYTCNSWTADVLNAGALPFNGLFTQMPIGLTVQHKLGWLLFPKYRSRTEFASVKIAATNRTNDPD